MGEKQETPTERVTLGSETRVRTQNTRALLLSWHRLPGDWSVSLVFYLSDFLLFHGDGWEESEVPSTELLEWSQSRGQAHLSYGD